MRHSDTYKVWCLPLMRLLCLNAADDEHREAVIKMGDDFDYRGLTYAAHICYVVAKVELGFRGQFHLIGCDSTTFPFGVKVLKEAIMRTETYEYVLSLTSGFAQPSFQVFKLCNTSRLTLIALYDIALEYCETITRAVLSFPGSFKRSFLKRVLMLSCSLQKKLEQEQEPEWMLELQELHSDKAADADVNSNAEPEQNVSPASSDAVSEIQDIRTGMSRPVMSPDLGIYTDPEDQLNSRYALGDLLGKGGFGAVFEGVRCEDGKRKMICRE
ncbi:Protein transport protein Sec16A [Bagarius yarrelli]|uniref:Protein transport protein Sec16A n=1 Tax=Bagarius yarrelli TaxID=175774 RepID=A0A556V9K0_BAGYA|nr:Protein transport protein Sec16A [Bagarius yarrelli]